MTFSAKGPTLPRSCSNPKALSQIFTQILLEAKKFCSNEILICSNNSSIELQLISIGSDQQKNIRKASLPITDQQLKDLFSEINLRSFYWPEEFSGSHPNKEKSLYINSLNSLNLTASIQQSKSKEPQLELSIKNIDWGNSDSHVEQLSLSETNLQFINKIIRSPNGLILCSCTGDGTVDATAIILSLRPDAIFYPNLTSVEETKQATKYAKDSLVVVGLVADDAFDMLLTFSGIQNHLIDPNNSDFKADSQSLILASYVHKRIRRVCSACAKPTVADPRTLDRLPDILRPPPNKSYLFGRGCDLCGHSSYHGTIGLDSVILLTDQLKNLLLSNAPIDNIAQTAYEQGTRTLLEDGLTKIFSGLTSYEEVLSITSKISSAFDQAIYRNKAQLHSCEWPQIKGPLDSSSPSHLLVVEDDSNQRSILETIFSKEGYKVSSVQNGKEALEFLQTKKVDLVVCDLMMPEMNGEQLVTSLRQSVKFKELPIMMLTVINDSESECQLFSLGVDDYCDKNIRRSVLLKRIQRLLSRTKQSNNPIGHLLGN